MKKRQPFDFFKRAIRSVVLKANHIPPLRYMNKIPYFLAIRSLVSMCRKLSGLKSLYVRNSFAIGNWTPGVSDIDLTLIISEDLSTEEEYYFFQLFRNQYHKLKTFFPMLGEFEILNRANLDSWTKYSMTGYESRNWLLLYGEQVLKTNYILRPKTFMIDRYNHCLMNYIYDFFKHFQRNGNFYGQSSLELQRLTNKILRYSSAELGVEKHVIKKGCDHELMGLIVKNFDDSLRNFTRSEPSERVETDIKNILNNAELNQVSFKEAPQCIRESADCHETIISITYPTEDPRAIFIVLKNDLDYWHIISCIRIAIQIFSDQHVKPVFMTYRTFSYFIRYYEPFVYVSLLRKRTILFGEDILPGIETPDVHFLTNGILKSATHILTYPFRYEFPNPSKSHSYSAANFENVLLGWFLPVKLFLEKGVLEIEYPKILLEYKKHYPGYYEMIKADELYNDAVNDDRIELKRFSLLRSIANDISKSMLNYEM